MWFQLFFIWNTKHALVKCASVWYLHLVCYTCCRVWLCNLKYLIKAMKTDAPCPHQATPESIFWVLLISSLFLLFFFFSLLFVSSPFFFAIISLAFFSAVVFNRALQICLNKPFESTRFAIWFGFFFLLVGCLLSAELQFIMRPENIEKNFISLKNW